MGIQVHLIAHTPYPDRTVAAAAKLCYSSSSVADIMDNIEPEHMRHFISHLLRSGHMSPFEHASFTFGIDGISRVCSHQLVRHRMASYSQQSQRYVSMDKPQFVTPVTLTEDKDLQKSFQDHCVAAHELYLHLVESGIPKEDARYLLPHGWRTRITVSMNARELHHFFRLRLCRRAQWEIQDLARRMLLAIKDVAPILFASAGPDCVVKGKCEEMRSCGRPFESFEDLINEPLLNF